MKPKIPVHRTLLGTDPMPELQQRLREEKEARELAPGHGNLAHTFYVGKGAERSSGTAARLLHIVALGGFVDLEGAGQKQDKVNHTQTLLLRRASLEFLSTFSLPTPLCSFSGDRILTYSLCLPSAHN